MLNGAGIYILETTPIHHAPLLGVNWPILGIALDAG